MEDEKQLLTNMFVEDKMFLDNLSNTIMNVKKISKSASRSEEVRKKGNEFFSKKNHDPETHIVVFNHYSKSISLAPLESEVLAQAYANRSAFLSHIQRYEDCIKDIDRTLKFTKSDVLTVKLLCRKVECLKKMGLSNYQSVLDAAENYADKLDKKDKAQVDTFIQKAKTCSINNDEISRDQPKKNDALPRMDETLDCISIEYTDKYGRHLVAKKDYSPGDFIFSDNLYVTVLNPFIHCTNCNYCLKIGWSSIPCDHCNWAMFCDEDCKRKAWNAYHDVECSVIPYLENNLSELFMTMQVSLRMLIVGIKEAGSVEKLKEVLNLVDQCKDIRKKGFYKDGQFSSSTIESVYSLQSSGLPQSELENIASNALIVLIALAKHSQLMKNFDLKNIDDLIKNEDMIFLGSLLIKFTTIKNINSDMFCQKACHCERLRFPGDESLCCTRGSCLSTLPSLLNHSCNPNACTLFTEDKKVAIFALQPIEKNSQIFITYVGGSYHNKSIEDRKEVLKKYNFTCKCVACVESWPPLMINSTGKDLSFSNDAETELCKDFRDIFEDISSMKMDFNQKDIKKLCEIIVQAERLPQPSLLSGILKDSLAEIYSRVYGWLPRIYAYGKCGKE